MNPDKKIRRLQTLLYTSGVGTILFSLWSAIRSIGEFFESFDQMASLENEEISRQTIEIMVGILLFFIIFIMVSLYIYIGRKAIVFSLGKKTGNTYIVLAILILILSFVTHVRDFSNFQPSKWFDPNNIIMFIIDLTSNVILGEIVVFSILLKKKRS